MIHGHDDEHCLIEFCDNLFTIIIVLYFLGPFFYGVSLRRINRIWSFSGPLHAVRDSTGSNFHFRMSQISKSVACCGEGYQLCSF